MDEAENKVVMLVARGSELSVMLDSLLEVTQEYQRKCEEAQSRFSLARSQACQIYCNAVAALTNSVEQRLLLLAIPPDYDDDPDDE